MRFGRLGRWFGTETYGLHSDLMTLAKGITSEYVPMSASLVSERVWEVLAQGSERYGVFGHGYTYTAHPVAAAARPANLAIIERDGLVEQAAKRGAYLRERLVERFGDHPMVGEVRGKAILRRRTGTKPFPAGAVRPVSSRRRSSGAGQPEPWRYHPCAAGGRHDRFFAPLCGD